MSYNPYNQYKKSSIQTASQGKLILMMYEGAIKFINIAISNMPAKKFDIVDNNLVKAQDIITELMLALNLEAGGEIAKNLYSLYEYMNRRLIEANLKKNADIANEVVRMLTELKEAWEIVIKKNNETQQSQFIAQPNQPQNYNNTMPGSGLNISG